MPSYQYLKDIKPEDLQPEPDKNYSKKEKASNWWHYHWIWFVVGGIALVLIIFFVRDIVTQVDPDLTIGVLNPSGLPDQLTTKLEEQLAELTEDTNGDGQVSVRVSVFTVNAPMSEEEIAAAEAEAQNPSPAENSAEDFSATMTVDDPYTQMAGVTQLSGALGDGNPIIYISAPDEAPAYQMGYGIFGGSDGTTPPDDADVYELTVRFADVPVLAGLDLNFELYDGTVISGQELLAEYRVGLRPLYDTQLEDKKDGAAKWEAGNSLLQSWLAG